MSDKQRAPSLDDLRKLWEKPVPGAGCAVDDCPARHVHIHAESITITNLIFAGELTPEIRAVMKAARATG